MLDQKEFTENLGAKFRVELVDKTTLEMTLIEVKGAGAKTSQHATGAGRAAPFLVLFRGPLEPVLPQAIYRLSHAALGEQDLFLVPMGPDNVGMAYEAVFS